MSQCYRCTFHHRDERGVCVFCGDRTLTPCEAEEPFPGFG
ncbi:ATPase involved in DNA repair/chromosome segregation [Giardia duodenalis assemblage B]|uniref:ATPase involved in DNA repair/chromosome segregation n=2 Tax=Giardia intestinalis TaxID=5741 RepID=A0A132NU92_GIAIN|nr:ATPase involved in DNA repair/chromosome segregation [Giardia intestinalis]KWX13647.1 ATPase involved in DNA repair/chromosome segregation [Giardia intestinalis assemblage B]